MPYILLNSDGTQLATIQDGTINSSAADLTFVGKNYSGYGQIVNENFLSLLENFAGPSPTVRPLTGQIWYDTANKKLNVFDGTNYRSLPFSDYTSLTIPNNQSVGDFYWDSANQKLYVYNGNTYTLIGPANNSSPLLSSINSSKVIDTNNNQQTVLKSSVGGVTNSIFFSSQSSGQFNVNPSDGVSTTSLGNISGFLSVQPGITLPGTDNNGVSANSGNYFWGTAGSATGLVEYNSGSWNWFPSTTYLHRSELAGFSGSLTLSNDDGVLVGVGHVLRLHVTSNTVGNLSNIVSTTVNFNVTKPGASSLSTVFAVDGSGGNLTLLPGANNQVGIGVSGNQFTNIWANTFNGSAIVANGGGTSGTSGTGTITGQWSLAPGSNISGGTVSATTANTSTYSSFLLGADSVTYRRTSQSADPNLIVQYDGNGGVVVSRITAVSGGSQLYGAWTLANGASIQATTLLGGVDGGTATGQVSASIASSSRTIVQRDAGQNINVGGAVNAASIYSPALHAGSQGSTGGLIYGNWSVDATSGSYLSASFAQTASLANTLNGYNNSGAISADTRAMGNTLVQRTGSGGDITAGTVTCGTLAGAGGAGVISGNWTLASGASMQATYADLAERYASDWSYEAGTVLIVGGTAEVTTTSVRADVRVAGIVSTSPAYKLNALAGDDATHPYIALKGRVPCKVIGPVKKGQFLVSSSQVGYAEAWKEGDSTLAIIGKALVDCGPEPSVIEVMV